MNAHVDHSAFTVAKPAKSPANADTAVSLFDFKGHQIRVVVIDGEPWFVATDVCRVLELDLSKGAFNHLKKLDAGEKRILPPNLVRGKGSANLSAISESGLYKLILRSDKPQAKPFQDWVTKEVLPAIRKDGIKPRLNGASDTPTSLRKGLTASLCAQAGRERRSSATG